MQEWLYSPHALIINTQFWFIALTLYLELGTYFHFNFLEKKPKNLSETHPDGKPMTNVRMEVSMFVLTIGGSEHGGNP